MRCRDKSSPDQGSNQIKYCSFITCLDFEWDITQYFRGESLFMTTKPFYICLSAYEKIEQVSWSNPHPKCEKKKSIQQSVSVFQSRRLSQSAERKMIDYLMQWTFVFLAPKNEDQQSSIRPVPVTASQGLNIWLHCFDLFYLHTSYSTVWTGVCYSTPKKLQPRKFLSSCPKSS